MRLHLFAGLGAPAHLTGVDEEDDGADDAVLESAAVAVGVVRPRDPDALVVGVVLDERDGGGVAAEGRARQEQPARRTLVRLAQRVAPAEGVTAMVHLVEDDEGALVDRQALVDGCLHRDLRVGHRDPVIMPGGRVVPVAERGVEPDADAGGGIRPLRLEVLGRRDHDQPVDDPSAQELTGEPQGEGRLAGARGRRGEEVARAAARTVRPVEAEVQVERLGLPRSQALRGAPRRALGVGRRQDARRRSSRCAGCRGRPCRRRRRARAPSPAGRRATCRRPSAPLRVHPKARSDHDRRARRHPRTGRRRPGRR